MVFQAKDHRWVQTTAGVFRSFDAPPAKGSLAFVSFDGINDAERIAKSTPSGLPNRSARGATGTGGEADRGGEAAL